MGKGATVVLIKETGVVGLIVMSMLIVNIE